MKSWEAYRTYAWATYGICFKVLVKMSTFVGKVNYDRPFTDHNGWEKENILPKTKMYVTNMIDRSEKITLRSK